MLKKIVPKFFIIRIEAKKIYGILEFNQSQWIKQYVEFNTQKEQKQKKMVTKMDKCCTN